MIHLDTNYLIGLLVRGSQAAIDSDRWLAAAEPLAASSIAWNEFLSGPITPLEVSRVEAVLQSRIVPFAKAEAALAADLFNQTGRRRGSRLDCLIAATAILSEAGLATVNQADFKPFVGHGLRLV
jgi:predicted nucleic acid-binding protein